MPTPVHFKAEYGDPVIVHVVYQGKRYSIRINVQVLGVTPTGETNASDGMPIFNVQAAPVMAVTAEGIAS